MSQPPLLWPPLETIRQTLCPVIPESATPDNMESMGAQNGHSAAEFSPVSGSRSDPNGLDSKRPDPYLPLQEYALRQQAWQQAFLARQFPLGLQAGRLVSVDSSEFPGHSLICLLDAPEKEPEKNSHGDSRPNNRWRCFVVSPECDWAGHYDVLLEPEDEPFHPVCGMVQTWHPVVLELNPQAVVLGELSPQRMAAIRAVHDEYQRALATVGDDATAQPGMIALRALGPHTVLTGSALSADDPRRHYQTLYREHVQTLTRTQEGMQEASRTSLSPATSVASAAASSTSSTSSTATTSLAASLSGWIKKGYDWFSADWLIRPAFAVLCLFFVGQMLAPENAVPDEDIRWRGAAQSATLGNTLTVYWRQDASSQAITQVLHAAGASIVRGPDSRNSYVLQAADVADLSARLKASGLTEKIEVAD